MGELGVETDGRVRSDFLGYASCDPETSGLLLVAEIRRPSVGGEALSPVRLNSGPSGRGVGGWRSLS